MTGSIQNTGQPLDNSFQNQGVRQDGAGSRKRKKKIKSPEKSKVNESILKV